MAQSLGLAVGAVGGYSKWREGRKMQKAGQAAIENFEWQDLSNPYETLSVSTVGADYRGEEMARASSSAIGALQGGGTRALVGGIGRVMQANVNTGREIAANLDEQQKAISYAAAGQDVTNQNMMERRQAEELAGYGQMMNVGMNMKYGGLSDMMNAGFAGGMFAGGMGGGMMGGGGQGGATAQAANPYSNSLPVMTGYPQSGAPATSGSYNDSAAMYANDYGYQYA